jgi:hypothetical protein
MSQVVPCGQADVAKLIVAFRNFAKAPKNQSSIEVQFNFGDILLMVKIVSEKLSTLSFPLIILLENIQQAAPCNYI